MASTCGRYTPWTTTIGQPSSAASGRSTSSIPALTFQPGTFDLSASIVDRTTTARLRFPAALSPLPCGPRFAAGVGRRRDAIRHVAEPGGRADNRVAAPRPGLGVGHRTKEREMSQPEQAVSTVSIVVLNFRGADDTITCSATSSANSTGRADRLEVVWSSTTRPATAASERIRAAFPRLELIESPENTGFAGGCNLGAARATGRYVAFLEQRRPAGSGLDPRGGRGARARADRSAPSPARSWTGTGETDRLRRRRGHLVRHGLQAACRRAERPGVRPPAQTCCSAPAQRCSCRRDLFRVDVGGFDERFFMFFEDVDLGWRLNLLGWRVRYVPTSRRLPPAPRSR